MRHASLHRAHVAVPLGLVGVAGALMVADFYGLSLDHASDGEARGALMLLTPIVGLLLGGALSLRSVRRGTLRTLVMCVLGTALAGAAIGAEATWFRCPTYSWSRAAAVGAVTGVGTSLAFLPVVLGVAFLGRRVGRARAGSIVDEQDTRRMFGVALFAIAIAAPLVTFAGEQSYGFSVGTSRALGGVATFVLSAMVILDLRSFARIRGAMFDVLDMRAADPRHVEVEDVVDVGLGEEAYEKLAEGGSAYRTNHLPIRAVLGEPALALDAVRGGLVQSVAMLTVAGAAGIVNLLAPG